MAQVTSFIQDVLEITSIQPTHVVYVGGNEEYQIKQGKTGRFWKTYGTFVDEKPGKIQLTLGEKISTESPLVIDLEIVLDKSLKFPETTSLDGHPLWPFVYEFIGTVQQLLFDMLDDLPESARYAVLLHAARELQLSQRYRWLYRIHFPLCHLDTAWQHTVFLPELLSTCRQVLVGMDEQLLVNTVPPGFNVCADWTDMVRLPQDSVPMYLGRKNPLLPELEYAMVLPDISTLDPDPDQTIPDIDLRSTFPITRHLHFTTGQCKLQEIYVKNNVTLNYTLAFVLSQWYAPECQYQPKASGTVSRAFSPNITAWDKRLSTTCQTSPNQQVIESLLPLLAPSRFQQEHTWMDIGRALFVTYIRSQRGLALWQKYTEAHSAGAFTYADCARLYMDSLCDTTIVTYRTVGFYAREDSPEDYKAWHRTWVENDFKVIFDSKQPTHADVAALLFKRYWMDLIYEHGVWYEYSPTEYGWTVSHKRDDIAERITHDFIPYIYEIRDEIITKQLAAPFEKKDEFNKPINAMNKLIEKLKDDGFCNQLIAKSQTRCIYKDPGFSSYTFAKRLDINPRLIRTKNGVLEVVGASVIFRTGKPEDYLTMQTKISYPEGMSMESPEVVAFLYWMKQIFDSEELVEYMLLMFASVLLGGQSDKILPIWYGVLGNNGKSTLMNCIKKALGDYHKEVSTSVATKGRGNAGGATPEWVPLLKTRMACMKEPEPNETFHVGTLKELTGNDSVYIRNLYQEGRDSNVLGKVFLHCNEVPEPNSVNDNGFKNRITIIPFRSTWSSGAPETLEEQRKMRHYKIDTKFEEKIYNYSRAWLWLAVHYYPKYAKVGLANKPVEVIKETQLYWDRADYYNSFRNTWLEADPKGTVTVTEMYEPFLQFLETDFQKKTGKPSKEKFRENIKKSLVGAEFKKDTFHGWKIRMVLV